MFELSAEAIVLLLRLVLVALLYLFLASVALAAARELRRLSQPQLAAVGPASPTRLIVLDPGDTGLAVGDALPLRSVTRIGRAQQNTIVIDGTFISAEHAAIVRRDGRWWLSDRGSTNGTALNERPVHGEVGLSMGDVVAIGDVRLRLAP
ncbi:MAG: FHA domain-containing protein [Chloroflexota bacterium]